MVLHEDSKTPAQLLNDSFANFQRLLKTQNKQSPELLTRLPLFCYSQSLMNVFFTECSKHSSFLRGGGSTEVTDQTTAKPWKVEKWHICKEVLGTVSCASASALTVMLLWGTASSVKYFSNGFAQKSLRNGWKKLSTCSLCCFFFKSVQSSVLVSLRTSKTENYVKDRGCTENHRRCAGREGSALFILFFSPLSSVLTWVAFNFKFWLLFCLALADGSEECPRWDGTLQHRLLNCETGQAEKY